MAVHWRDLCGGERIEFAGDDVIVYFDNHRKHRVRVRELDDRIEFEATVAGAAAIEGVEGLPLALWEANRALQLVSLRIDPKGHVRAHGWVPRAGLTAAEFQLVLRRVAEEADRIEYRLTGRDAH